MQSVGIEELHESEGVLIEATGSPPGMGAISAPGVRRPTCWAGSTAPPTAAMIGAMIADEPSGRVFGSRVARSSPTASPRPTKAASPTAIRAMARVMLAAGASDVELGGGAPAVRSEAELEAAMQRLDVRRLRLAGFHPTRHRRRGLGPGPPSGRPRGTPARRRGRLGRRRLDPAQLPGGQPPGLDHGDGDRGRRSRRQTRATAA